MARPKNQDEKPLTETELLIMNILWQLKSATVHDVLEELSKTQAKNYAYTTVSTLLRVLEKKNVVLSEKEGRGHRYLPAVQRENYQKKATVHLLNQVYSGEASSLIKNLIGNSKLSDEEINEVRELLLKKGAGSE